MIMDSQELFSGAIAADGTRSAQAITATAISTNVLDLRNAATPALADEGMKGQELWLIVQVIAAFNTLTSLTITLESDSASTLASAPVVHYSKTIALAALTAGSNAVRVQIPSDDYKRYLGVRYTVTGTNPTLGSVIAFLTLDPQRNVIYPSGFTVDA
jgi:hypothetical protein